MVPVPPPIPEVVRLCGRTPGARGEVAGGALVATRHGHLRQVAGAGLLDAPLGGLLQPVCRAHVRLVPERGLLRLLQAQRRPAGGRTVAIVRGLRADEDPEHHEWNQQDGEGAGSMGGEISFKVGRAVQLGCANLATSGPVARRLETPDRASGRRRGRQ